MNIKRICKFLLITLAFELAVAHAHDNPHKEVALVAPARIHDSSHTEVNEPELPSKQIRQVSEQSASAATILKYKILPYQE